MQRILKFFYTLINKLYFLRASASLKKNSKTISQILNIWKEEKKNNYEEINEYEKKVGFSIQSDFLHELGLLTQVTDKKSKISYSHGRLLYSCLSKYCSTNNITNINILEVGTARGFSSLCMAKALEDNSISGKIITMDILPLHKKIYWNCKSDELGKINRNTLLKDYDYLIKKYIIFLQFDTLSDYKRISLNRVNFAFIDGCHDGNHLKSEFEILKNSQLKGDQIIFDDYSFEKFPTLYNEINKICNIYNYSKEVICSDKGRCYLIATKI